MSRGERWNFQTHRGSVHRGSVTHTHFRRHRTLTPRNAEWVVGKKVPVPGIPQVKAHTTGGVRQHQDVNHYGQNNGALGNGYG